MIQDQIITDIVAAMHELRPPEWTLDPDFKHRSRHWWLKEMNPTWLAEEYLDFLYHDEEPLRAADRDLVKKIGKEATKLADSMKRCKSHELYSRFSAIKSNHVLDKPGLTFGVLERALERLSKAVSEVEFSIKRGNKQAAPSVLAVAQLAATHFHRITWEQPGRTVDQVDGVAKASGAFLEYLKKVYKALGIAASVEDNARKAAAKFKEPSTARTLEERFPNISRILPQADMEPKDENPRK